MEIIDDENSFDLGEESHQESKISSGHAYEGGYDLRNELVIGKRDAGRCPTLDSVPSLHSKRNYANALDDLFTFCASRPLSIERVAASAIAVVTNALPYLSMADRLGPTMSILARSF